MSSPILPERALVAGSAATRIPPTVLAYLCSSFLGSVESITILQCCRAWCLRGTDRLLLQHMLAEATSHASAASDGSDEPTVDGSFYRTPHGQSPSVELPWRQRHMESVQHVLVQLQDEGVSEPLILPSFEALPPPSSAPAAFTLVRSPFELRWSSRRMRPELVVFVRIQPLASGVNAFSQAPKLTSSELKQQSDLWCMLGRAFKSASRQPLAVTIVDERASMAGKREGDKPLSLNRTASTIALSARWLRDPVASDVSNPFSSSSSSSSLKADIVLLLHSLVFHTRRHDFIAAALESLRIATIASTPLSRRIQIPPLPIKFRRWFLLNGNGGQIARLKAANLLSPLNVLYYRSVDASHPAGFPAVFTSLMSRPPNTRFEDTAVGHAIHTLYVDVRHEVDIAQVLRPLSTRHPRPQEELYLIGVGLSQINLQAFERVRTLVLKAPSKRDFDPMLLDFSMAFGVLAQSLRQVRSIEMIGFRFSSPSALKAWCPRATDIRLDRCVFDDDDGWIDLEAHANSLWPVLHVHGGPPQVGPRWIITPGPSPSLFPLLFDPFFRNSAMAFMMLPFMALCMLPMVGVDAVLMYLPFSGFTRMCNLGGVLMMYTGLAYTFFSLLIAEWNQFESIPGSYRGPPTATMFVQNGVVLFAGCTLWFNALLGLPWHRAGIEPLPAVVCVSVLKMLFNSLSGANTARWIRVQRSKIDWRAFSSYFVRLTILRTVQLRWFVTTYAGIGWFVSVLRRHRAVQPFSMNAGHSLAQRLFADTATSVAAIEYVAPSQSAPSLWTVSRALVREMTHGIDAMGWLRSWINGAAWMSWLRVWGLHLRSVLHALPAIFALALILFAVQILVRKVRRALTARPLILTWPLRFAGLLLKCIAHHVHRPRTVTCVADGEADAQAWLDLIEHPNVQRITAITMEPCFLRREHMEVIAAHLPQLTSVRVSNGSLDPQSVVLLPTIRKLEHIRLDDGDEADSERDEQTNHDEEAQVAPPHPLTACSKLRSLLLVAWRAFLVTRLLSHTAFSARLTELALNGFDDDENKPSAEACQQIFESLSSLRRLIVDRNACTRVLLSTAVSHCPSLAELMVRPAPFAWLKLWGSLDIDAGEAWDVWDEEDPPAAPSAAEVSQWMECRQAMLQRIDSTASPLRIQLWLLDRAVVVRHSNSHAASTWQNRIRGPLAQLGTPAESPVQFELLEDAWNDMLDG